MKTNFLNHIILACFTLLIAGCGNNQPLEEDQPMEGPVAEEIPSNGEVVGIHDMKVGFCGEAPANTTLISYAIARDCNEPHDFEVSGLLMRPEGPDADYPSSVTLERESLRACRSTYESYLGKTYIDLSVGIDVIPIPPSSITWDGGDRQIICVLVSTLNDQLDSPAKSL